MRYNEKIQLKLYEYNGTQFVLQAIIDDYEQISFEHSLYSAGAFTVSINYNIPNAKLFRRGLFIQFGNNPDDFGEIYTLTNSIGSDGKGSEKLNISGYDARYLFKRRVIKNLNSNDVWAMTAKGEICLRNLIYSECGLGAEEKRRLPIENIIPSEADASGGIYSVSEAYTNLYDVLCTIATQSQIGWSVKFIDGELKLVCFNGRDKRHEVFFATDYESLVSGSFSDSFSSYANIIYIGGKGEGSERDLYEGIANQEGFLIADSGTYLTTENGEKFILSNAVEPGELNRFEAFDNQSSMTTEEEYENEAESMLTQYAQTLNVSGAGLAKCPFVFREQYDVGDIITLRFSEKEEAIQILSVTEQWSKGSYTLNFSFGKPQNNLADQLQLILRKIQLASNKGSVIDSVRWYTIPTDTTMGQEDLTFNTLGFTGNIGNADRTFTLYFDNNSKAGSKSYSVYTKNLSGSGKLILSTGVSGASNLELPSGNNVASVYVDENGNIISSEFGTISTVNTINGKIPSNASSSNQLVTQSDVNSAVSNDGLLSSYTEIARNVTIPYPANKIQYTMPKSGIANLILTRDSAGYSCWIYRNGNQIFNIDNWLPGWGSWALQFKVKQGDVIRIDQNSTNDSSRWSIGNFTISR